MSGFPDAIDHATYGMPDGYPNVPRDRMPVSIDFYDNDVSNVHDSAFRGSAPDLGAYEYGAEVPHYGPRPPVAPRRTH